MALRALLSTILLVFPWQVRRLILNRVFGYCIDPTARIGLSIVLPGRLEMGPGSRIGDLTVCKGLALVRMGEKSVIGSMNWISGFPEDDPSFFDADSERHSELIVGCHAAITNRHLIDCTNSVRIGKFTTIAGN